MTEIAEAQPTAVDTLAEAVEAAVIHKFTLGTSMGADHEVYHRFAVSTARRVMEIVAPVVARLQEEQEATQAAYDNAVRWHHAYAREIKRLDGTIPEDAPDLAETLAHLVAVYGPDAFQAAADDI